ncbi:hypothetical protein, partial [Nostoc sp.]|uniref:hypothetical protein n=1 Tax=Nostoc sp. TaxID=1180 RepID=UPI002FF4972C
NLAPISLPPLMDVLSVFTYLYINPIFFCHLLSSLIMHHLATAHYITCASPQYLAQVSAQ